MIDKKLQTLRSKSFLSIQDFDSYQISSLIKLALEIKNKRIDFDFSGKTLGLIFEKSSTRTRVSFQIAMQRLHGSCIEINPSNKVYVYWVRMFGKPVLPCSYNADCKILGEVGQNIPGKWTFYFQHYS